MRYGDLSTEPRPRCPRCGKARYDTFTQARKAAVGLMRERPGVRGIRAYWSKRCQAYHAGTQTDQIRAKARRKT